MLDKEFVLKNCPYRPHNAPMPPDNSRVIEVIDKVGLQGAKGDPGLTPYIGKNNNWWIGIEDTGVNAYADTAVFIYNTKDDFPKEGSSNSLYIDKLENNAYRWDDDTSTYIQLSTVDSSSLISWAEDYFGNTNKAGYKLIKDTALKTVEEETVPIIATALKDEDKDKKTQKLAGTISDYHLKDKDDTYSGISIDKLDTEDLILTANNEA